MPLTRKPGMEETLTQTIEEKYETEKSNLERVLAEMEHKQITYDGLQRSYWKYVPDGHRQGTDHYPLLIALHGGTSTGKSMALLTEFNNLARKDGFIVVYPDGVEKHWNDGRDLQMFRCQHENINDVGFISALIDQMAAQHPVDLDRVYVTGISNGAMMAHRVAVELSSSVAAAAMVAGNIPENYKERIPEVPVPMLVMNGTEDQIMPWSGGTIGFITDRGRAVSVKETINFWRVHNNCQNDPEIAYKPDIATDDGTRVRTETYINKAGTAMAMLYAIEGGGHTWPGANPKIRQNPPQVPKEYIGLMSSDIDGSEEIYTFFKQHSRNKE